MTSKKPRPYKGVGLGILNPYGDLWTDEVFATPEEARKHLDAFWDPLPDGARHKLGFKCVGVSVTVRALDTEDLWAPLAEETATHGGTTLAQHEQKDG